MSPILGIYASQISGHLFAPSGAYDSIATTTVGAGGASTISFTSIPSTYTHLQLRMIAKQTTATAITTGNLYFNNDTTNTNYARHELYGDGASVAANGIPTGSNSSKIVFYAGSGTQFGPSVIDILDYTNTNKNKTVRALGGVDNDGSGYATFTSGLWLSTAAITRIDLTFSAATSQQYSSFALYGIRGN